MRAHNKRRLRASCVNYEPFCYCIAVALTWLDLSWQDRASWQSKKFCSRTVSFAIIIRVAAVRTNLMGCLFVSTFQIENGNYKMRIDVLALDIGVCAGAGALYARPNSYTDTNCVRAHVHVYRIMYAMHLCCRH